MEFGEIYSSCNPQGWFFISNGYLYYIDKLCTPNGSILELLVRESHCDNLMGHFGAAQTHTILQEHFYWPCMNRDVERLVEGCVACRQAKSMVQPYGLHTPLPILKEL